MNLPYFNNCVNWNPQDVDALTELINRTLRKCERDYFINIEKEC